MIGQVKNRNIIAQKAKNTKKSMINSNYIQPCTVNVQNYDSHKLMPIVFVSGLGTGTAFYSS
jgi:hypothetical protein